MPRPLAGARSKKYIRSVKKKNGEKDCKKCFELGKNLLVCYNIKKCNTKTKGEIP